MVTVISKQSKCTTPGSATGQCVPGPSFSLQKAPRDEASSNSAKYFGHSLLLLYNLIHVFLFLAEEKRDGAWSAEREGTCTSKVEGV